MQFVSHTNSYLKASFSVNLCLLTLWQLSLTNFPRFQFYILFPGFDYLILIIP